MTEEELNQKIDELWEWAKAVLPIYGDRLRVTWHETDYLFDDAEGSVVGNVIGNTINEYKRHGKDNYVLNQLEEVLSNPDDERRLILAMDAFLTDNPDMDGRRRYISTEDGELRFKRYINNIHALLSGKE